MSAAPELDYFADFRNNWWYVYLPRLFKVCPMDNAALNQDILHAVVETAMDVYGKLYEAYENRTGRFACHVLFQLPEQALLTIKEVSSNHKFIKTLNR